MYRHDVISDFGFDAGLRRRQIVLNLRTSHKLPIEVSLVLPAAARGVSLSPCLPVFRSHSRRTTVRVARNPAPHTITAPATDAAVYRAARRRPSPLLSLRCTGPRGKGEWHRSPSAPPGLPRAPRLPMSHSPATLHIAA